MLTFTAKKKQRKIEARIGKIKRIIKRIEISRKKIECESVRMGSIVKLHHLEYDEYETYAIVEHDKVNSLKNKISCESPIGMALMGKKVGDKIVVKIPTGYVRYKILELVDVLEEYRDYVEKAHTASERYIRKSPEKTVEILPKHFITRVNTFHCSVENHNIVDIMCQIKVSRRDGEVSKVLVPGAFCEKCNRYYLLEVEYERLKHQGIPLCRIVEYDFWTAANQREFSGLNKESILHMMGYNVNSQENLTTKQRWTILETIADAKILSITEIRSHLEWLIRRSNNKDNFENARAKWECDSKHMSKYMVDKQSVVDVASISKKNYRMK